MKKLVIAILLIPGFIVSLVIYALWSFNIHKLIICSSDPDTFYLPSSICEKYMYHFRGNKEDIDFLDQQNGISFLFETKDKDKKYKMLDFFLKNGANINLRNEIDGLTPLHIAVLNNDVTLVKFLLKHGADKNIKDKHNKMTPLEFAKMLENKNPEVNRQSVIKALSDVHGKP